MYVSVIGGDTATCTKDDRENAERIGAGIARMGAVLVCGGRGGVMEAACKGAISEGGTTDILIDEPRHSLVHDPCSAYLRE